MKSGLLAVAAFAAVLLGCKENLSAPGHCPELCPGTQIPVFDTIIVASAGSDSSFLGYIPHEARQGLLVANGLPAGDSRALVVFPMIRTDSFPLDGIFQKFTPDTAAFTVTLQTRDTLSKNLKIYLHRLPLTVDTNLTFTQLDALIAQAPAFDSILVADTVKTGNVQVFLTGTELGLVTTGPADSGKIAIGFTVAADRPTGVRIALDPLSLTTTAPAFEFRGKVDIADTTRQRQTTTVRATAIGKVWFVTSPVRAASFDPDLLYLGGPLAARSLIRFAIPIDIKDTAQILKATLELTPAAPLYTLPNSLLGDSISARAVVVDLGSKSPPVSTSVSPTESAGVVDGMTGVISINVLPFVTQWKAANGPPQVLLLFHNLENVGFLQPVFYSTRSAFGKPQLRITYALPTGSNTP